MEKFFTIILFFILIPVFSLAQEHTHRFYTVYDGLPQSQVQYITQDSTGYIWVATKGGVARFDGINFEVFTTKHGLVSNIVYKIIPTDSCIWFLSVNGITKLKQGKWTPYPFNGKHIQYIGVYEEKMAFWEVEKGNWIFDNNQFVKAKFYPPLNNKGTYHFICKNHKDSSYIIFSRKKGIYHLKNGKETLIDFQGGDINFLPDSNKILYSNYYKSRNILVDLNTYEKKYWGKDDSGNYFNGYTLTKNGVIHLINRNKVGFYLNHKFTFIHKKFNLVVCSFIDNSGNIWVADEDGLYRFNKLEFTEFTKENSEIAPYVWDIKEFPTGNYWFISHTSGLQKYKDGVFQAQPTFNDSYGKPTTSFYMNTPPANDSILILNHSEGVIKYDGIRFSKLINEISVPAAGLATFCDTINKLYFVGAAPEKLYVGNGNAPAKIYQSSDTTFKKNILAITYDRDNDICLGTLGIVKYKNGKFHKYPNIPDTLSFRVYSLQKDFKENLWIGTDQGLWFYNYDTIFQVNNKYFTGYITFLQPVDSTWLMGGTTLGLPLLYLPDFYKQDIQKVKYYDRYNGFTGRDCGQNGTLHDSKNTFWIPTIDRVLRFDPTKIEFNTKPPVISIKGISLLGENLSWAFIGNTVHKLNHNQNGLKFSFIGLNYSAPERVRYKYRLIGFGKKWSEESPEREVIFTNLPPGKYTFELLACNEDEYWTKTPVSYSFEIIPAWYQRLSAKILGIILLVISVTYTAISVTKRKAENKRKNLEFEIALQKEELEKQNYQKLYHESQLNIIKEKIKGQDEERTRIARELHDGIGGNLVGIKLMVEEICKNPQKNGLDHLIKVVSDTLDEVRTISHNLMPPEFNRVSLSNVLTQYVDKLNMASDKKFTIQFLPKNGCDLIAENIQIEVYRILQELCSNTLKYSDATDINIQLSKFDGTLNIIMEDNGSSFNYSNNGIGYRNITERLKLLNGIFEKNSCEASGNVYHITIPLI